MTDPQQIQAPQFSNSEIIRRAEKLTKQFAKSIEPEIALLFTSFDAIYAEIIYPEFEIELRENYDLGFDEDGVKILGEYDWYENVCLLYTSPSPRD